MRADPYVIGLTGNIAAGKSTVAAMLGRLGACVIDADQLAHQVMRAGTEVYRVIVMRFGEGVLDPNGEIDRSALGGIVFSDPDALRDLERLVHPAVIEETRLRLRECRNCVCVVEAIKLLEAGMDALCDVVWVVTASRGQQIDRLMRERHLTAAQAQARIEAQPSPEAKLARADVVIDNSGSLEEAWAQVLGAWEAGPRRGGAP